MGIIRKVIRKIQKPGELFRYGSIKRRAFYISLSRILRPLTINPRIYIHDTKYAKKTGLHTIDHASGYLHVEALESKFLICDVLGEAQKDLKNHLKQENQKHHKKYLQVVDSTNALNLDHPYLKLALSEELIGLATRYLGFTPILSDIILWYSPNIDSELEGSQFFHLDYADVSQVKVFVLITDVDEDSGPTAIVDAKSSQVISMAANYRLSNKDIRIPDETVFSHVKPSDIIRATGRAGSLFIADTSRCLHYGSRKAKKPRAVLLIQYVSPFSFRYSLQYWKETKFRHLISKANTNEINLLLGSN
jgi:hypothetical protein